MRTDREIAYEQNVTNLERAWRDRIEGWAAHYVRVNRGEVDVHLAATDDLSSRLLLSGRWENVTAMDITDIAYEAVGKALTAERMVS